MSSFYSDPSVGGDGNWYSDDRDPNTGLGADGHRKRLVPMLASLVAIGLWIKAQADWIASALVSILNSAGTLATSVTPASITAIGATFQITIQTGKLLTKGQWIVAASTASPVNQVIGYILDYNSATGVLQLYTVAPQGTGSFSSWSVALCAPPGAGVASTRSITGGGLVTGGGDLSANRVLTVTKATVAQLWAGLLDTVVMTPKLMFDGAASQALADGASIAPNGNNGINFHVTLGGDRALANPTNFKPGQGGRIRLVQDATGNRKITLGSAWKVSGGTDLSTAPGSIDRLDYFVHATDDIECAISTGYGA